MKFGAHEVMEASEILQEKMNLINHLSLYEQEAQSAQLRALIRRHLDTAVQGYDQMVAYTHDYSARFGMMPPYAQPDANVEMIKYGLRHPQPVAPQQGARLDDMAIQAALLGFHRASAVCHMQRGLEVADPHLRQMFLNGAITCFNQAYETFLFMNQQGTYQVPTMDDHTAKTYLHTYQPMGQSPMGQGSMGQQSMGQGSMGQTSMGQPPVRQGSIGQGTMGQSPYMPQ